MNSVGNNFYDVINGLDYTHGSPIIYRHGKPESNPLNRYLFCVMRGSFSVSKATCECKSGYEIKGVTEGNLQTSIKFFDEILPLNVLDAMNHVARVHFALIQASHMHEVSKEIAESEGKRSESKAEWNEKKAGWAEDDVKWNEKKAKWAKEDARILALQLKTFGEAGENSSKNWISSALNWISGSAQSEPENSVNSKADDRKKPVLIQGILRVHVDGLESKQDHLLFGTSSPSDVSIFNQMPQPLIADPISHSMNTYENQVKYKITKFPSHIQIFRESIEKMNIILIRANFKGTKIECSANQLDFLHRYPQGLTRLLELEAGQDLRKTEENIAIINQYLLENKICFKQPEFDVFPEAPEFPSISMLDAADRELVAMFQELGIPWVLNEQPLLAIKDGEPDGKNLQIFSLDGESKDDIQPAQDDGTSSVEDLCLEPISTTGKLSQDVHSFDVNNLASSLRLRSSSSDLSPLQKSNAVEDEGGGKVAQYIAAAGVGLIFVAAPSLVCGIAVLGLGFFAAVKQGWLKKTEPGSDEHNIEQDNLVIQARTTEEV